MISTEEVKKILQLKKTELDREKQQMGLIIKKQDYYINAENKTEQSTNLGSDEVSKPQISTTYQKTEIRHNNGSRSGLEDPELPRTSPTPPEVAKYMRRYAGLSPAMLKTGEYSPNNPLLLRPPDSSGDIFLGLGEYEEQKKKLRKLRQQEYKDYLDKQSKQRLQQNALLHAKNSSEQNYRPTRYSDSTVEIHNSYAKQNIAQKYYDKPIIAQNMSSEHSQPQSNSAMQNFELESSGNRYNVQNSNRTVDSTTQCDDLGYYGRRKPSSVAVQTDETELAKLSENFKLRRSSETNTQAERELSPRTVMDTNLIVPNGARNNHNGWNNRNDSVSNTEPSFVRTHETNIERNDERGNDGTYFMNNGLPNSKDESYQIRNSPRSKLLQDLRHSYMPSILDADDIQRRNLKAEEEAAMKRESYQKELRHQILEQQRIKEERKAREKLLEQAEMRRLEQQLRTLQLAQDTEKEKQNKITSAMRENNKQYLKETVHLQNEIDAESKKLRVKSQTTTRTQEGSVTAKTWKSEHDRPLPSNLPLYYAYKPSSRKENERKSTTNERLTTKLPFSTNIPDTSLFSPKYKSSYLSFNSVPYRFDKKYANEKDIRKDELHFDNRNEIDNSFDKHRNIDNKHDNHYDNFDKTDIEHNPMEMREFVSSNNVSLVKYNRDERKRTVANNGLSVSEYKPLFRETDISELYVRGKSDCDMDSLPIPVLRHSSNNLTKNFNQIDNEVLGEKLENEINSDAMKKVESKWQIPIVQRNIVRSVPDIEGRSGNGSILTQLGSIRRQLQLEQLKLDKLLSKDDLK